MIREYKNIIAFHPGVYIKDLMEDLTLTHTEFANHLNISPSVLSDLVKGKSILDEEIAQALDKFTGISCETWINLQMTYEKRTQEITVLKAKDNLIGKN